MASHSADPALLSPPPPMAVQLEPSQMEFYEEEDVDQLDSDSDAEEEMDATSSSARKGTRREGKRIPGQTLLPAGRMEQILQGDGVISMLPMSKEALFLVSIATEEFIKKLTLMSQRSAASERRSMVVYGDISLMAQQYREFLFLQDTIPHPMSIVEALERRETREKEGGDVDLGISTATNMLHATSLSTSGPSTSVLKSKGKMKTTNGKEKVANGTSTAKKETKPRKSRADKDGETSGNRSSSRNNRGTRAAPREDWPEVRPAEPIIHTHTGGAILANGASPHRYSRQPQWAANQTTMRSDDFVEDPHTRRVFPSPAHEEGDGWNGGQYVGPPATYLPLPFTRVVPQNPGRTIYSQQPPS